ncbi:MAG: ABC transporter ATP-binding protein [Zoogloeaceae bacterium]|nr:ABC transporter ATP-binding protein [Zoogloeaceae bacterium]
MERTQALQAETVIEARDLAKIVPVEGRPEGLTILRGVAFAVARGETVAIVGASGSGKSTLLGLLAGLDVPSSGAVCIEGQDIFALSEDDRASMRGARIGFVFQSFHLLPSLTALDNVMLPLELAGHRQPREVAKLWLERVGLGARLSHYPKHLSGGEQQRVALARAFAPSPAVLLADEPTGNLDAATGAAVIELLFDINREHGTTLVLVTHDEALASRCGRVLRMGGGTLAESRVVGA